MRQRGDAQLRVYVGRDPLTGEKRWTSKTEGGKREAQRALAAIRLRLRALLLMPAANARPSAPSPRWWRQPTAREL